MDHAQFVNCGTALQFDGYGTTFQYFRVGNVLMHNVGTGFYGYSFNGTVEHLTADACTTLTVDYNDTGATYHPNWYVKDNLFDTATISFTGNGGCLGYVSRSNNRFYSSPAGGLEGSPVNLTALTYATGAFGPWYIPSSTPTLVDQGSRTAAAAGGFTTTRCSRAPARSRPPRSMWDSIK